MCVSSGRMTRGHPCASSQSSPGPTTGEARPGRVPVTPAQGSHDRSRLRPVRPPRHRHRGRRRLRPHADVRRGWVRRQRPARRDDRGPQGPVHRRDGPVGLRQVHADAPAGRPRHAGRGLRPHRGRGHHAHVRPRPHAPAPQAHRLRLPVVQPAADALRRGEHHAAARDRGPQAGAARRRPPARSHGPDRAPRPQAGPALRRPAAARRRRPRPDLLPDRPVRGRADGQPGLRVGRRRARSAALRGGRGRPDDRHGHARRARRGVRGPRAVPGRRPRGRGPRRPVRGRDPRRHARRGHAGMIKVTWKGLAARPIRTALTTLAIVVGVAFVCAAYTLTDTMSGAADNLTHAAYDGTDAVVVTKTSFKGSQTSDIRALAPTIPATTLDKVRSAPGVTTAVGDITDTAQVMTSGGKPVGTGPYFGVGFDAKTPGAERLTPFRLHEGRWATGPGEVVIDRATAESQDYAVGEQIQVAARGEAQTFTLTGIANFASVKSLGKASAAVFDLEAARTLFAKDGYDRLLVAGRRADIAGAAGPNTDVRTAAEDDRFAFSSLDTLVSILRTILLAFAAVAVLVGAFTIFNSLSITVAQRTKEFGLLRMVGATRRQVRFGVLLEALLVGLLASAAGVGVGVVLAEGLNALFDAVGMQLPAED